MQITLQYSINVTAQTNKQKDITVIKSIREASNTALMRHKDWQQ